MSVSVKSRYSDCDLLGCDVDTDVSEEHSASVFRVYRRDGGIVGPANQTGCIILCVGNLAD
jgi:hypothetical protein